MKPYVETIYRDPFVIGSPETARLRTGLNVSQMVERMRFLPPDFAETGTVRINDGEIPREWWGLVKPKATSVDKPITVTFHAAIRGGGDEEGGKSGLALIATIVVAVAAIVASEGALAPLFGPSITPAGSAIIASNAISPPATLALAPLVTP